MDKLPLEKQLAHRCFCDAIHNIQDLLVNVPLIEVKCDQSVTDRVIALLQSN